MDKEDNGEKVLCFKYQEEQRIEEGCKHPKDYCPYRQSCLIYFYSKEKKQE